MITTLETTKHVIEFSAMKNRRGPLDTAYGWADLAVNVIRDTAPDQQNAAEFK